VSYMEEYIMLHKVGICQPWITTTRGAAMPATLS
jgi:hypothetical protein